MFVTFQEEQTNQDDSESEIDEIEPRLKYVRMKNDLENILKKDAASCIAVHPKVLEKKIFFQQIYNLQFLQNHPHVYVKSSALKSNFYFSRTFKNKN